MPVGMFFWLALLGVSAAQGIKRLRRGGRKPKVSRVTSDNTGEVPNVTRIAR